MIIKEYHSTREDGVKLFRSFSDQEVLIRKLGTQQTYAEAIDVEYSRYRYVETDTPIEASHNDDVQESTENGAGSEHVQS